MKSFADRVEALFRQCPNEWIDAKVFMEIGGRMAWRTRISDVRKRGLTIENRTRRIVNGQTTFVRSEYRWVTATIADAAAVSVNADGQASFI